MPAEMFIFSKVAVVWFILLPETGLFSIDFLHDCRVAIL